MGHPYRSCSLPGPRHIRLLQLACQGPDLAHARWRFSVVNLDSLPCSYFAVSYVWGGDLSAENGVFFEGGGCVNVTDSAAAVLRGIVASKATKYYWMDALCINQRNNEEKSYQIPLMYDIYSSSEKVLAWAGEDSEDSEAALDFIPVLVRQVKKLVDDKTPITMHILNQTKGCEYPSSNWTALAHLLERPFFSRIWIVQEMAISSNAMLICGKWQIPWKELGLLISILMGSGLERCISTLHGDLIHSPLGATGLTVTAGIRHLIREERKPTLSWNLLTCHPFRVTDPRDRIFALLNISSDADDEALKPKCSKPVKDVFIDSTIHPLRKRSESISLLYAAGIGMKRAPALRDLPSWVTDWTTPHPGTIFGAIANTAEFLGKQGFRACGTSFVDPCLVCSPDMGSIRLKAQIFDAVESIASPVPDFTFDRDSAARRESHTNRFNWLTELSRLVGSSQSYPAEHPFFPDVLARTLIADGNSSGDLALESAVTNFLNYYAVQYIIAEMEDEEQRGDIPPSVAEWIEDIKLTVAEILKKAVDNDGHPLSPTSIQQQLGDPPYVPKAVAESAALYANAMSAAIASALGIAAGPRRVYKSRNGHLGLCPPLSRENDPICLIYGTNVPFLVRPREIGADYFLVGETYLHGVMFGEAMGKATEKEVVFY